MTLWSRRYVREGWAPHTVEVDEREVRILGKKNEAHATLGAGWSFVRAAHVILGWVKEGASPEDPPAQHRFHPQLPLTWDPSTTTHPEVEKKLGLALVALEPKGEHTAELLHAAGPLVLLEWPVGFRFAEIFEARLGVPAAERALTAVATELSQRKARLPAELARVCALQKNASALAPLLKLAEHGASVDGYFDLCDLAAEVGKKSDAAALERLSRGKVPSDVRDTLLAVARELKKG